MITGRARRLLAQMSGRPLMSEIAFEPSDADRASRERARDLAVSELPLLRAIGSVFLSAGVFLNNRFALNERSIRPWLIVTCLLAGYVLASTILLRLFYRRNPPVDLSLTFLVGDVVIWTLAIYHSGADRSLLFFIPLLRVADQIQTTLKRCVGFAALASASYCSMLLWVYFIDGEQRSPRVAFVKLIFITVSGIYIAMAARTSESRRARMAQSMRVGRELIQRLESQSEQLVETTKRAEAASAAKSEFLANMSHEMRTPLHGILGMLQLVRDDERSPQRARQLDLARQSADALLETIDGLLDFSKIEARRIELEPVYFSLRDMMTETMRALGANAGRKMLDLAFLVEHDVPDAVRGDSVRLRQILVNLVGNSIKFTPAGGEVSVRTSRIATTDETRMTLRFSVSDTGIGIDPSKRGVIFEPFAQADSSHSRQYGGTGLGLSIVSSLVEAMGGSVTVTGGVGRGSAFSFTIRVDCDPASAGAGREPWEAGLTGVKVLVVDHSETSRELLSEMLRSRGMNVEVATSMPGPEAIGFDCIVSAESGPAPVPVVQIVSSLSTSSVASLRIARPVAERELIDAIGAATGLTETREKALDVVPQLAPAGRRLRVLVAEDHPVNQEFAAEALRRLGHSVTVAMDGNDALASLMSRPFDVVLMDVQMPGMDGLQVTRRVRAAGQKTTIIALTAHTRKQDRDRCLEAGMDAVMTKPIDARELGDLIQSLTRGGDPIIDAVGGNLKLLAKVGEAFARQTPVLLQTIRGALDLRDGETLYQAAHKLKGSVSHFQGLPAVDLALQLERAAQDGDFERAGGVMPRLEGAVRDLERRIELVLAGTVRSGAA